MRTSLRPLGFSLLFFFAFAGCASVTPTPPPPPVTTATVVTYPAPTGANGIRLSSAFSVTANGANVDVYRVKVASKWIGYEPCPTTNEIASMAYFDFSGTVNVRITSAVSISNVAIRPLRHNIQPVISGNTITFSLSNPVNLSIEINGDDRHNLHLFANPLEQNKPSPSDPNVQYYGPGVYGDGSGISVPAGKTVYIAGGAVIHGTLSVAGGGDVTIRGRGIITGEKRNMNPCVRNGGSPMVSTWNGANNLNLEGFIVLDPPADWAFALFNIGSVTMDNVKSIAWRGNGDGIDLVSVSRALVKNVFIRATDDTFIVKADPSYFPKSNRPSENIIFENSVNWADGAGHAIGFGEQTTPYIRNVQFRNIDIIHTYVPAVWFSCCDASGEQYNVTFDDIRVEDMQGSYDYKVFDISPNLNGNVRDVYVNNFQILGGNKPPSTISGSDSSHMVSNVTFNNLNYLGTYILSPLAGQFSIGNYTANIKFTGGGTLSPLPPPPSPAL
jgi:hypothetical protein